MSTFFDDMVNDLTDAIAIEKGEIETKKIFDLPAPTYIAADSVSQTSGQN